jgi:hypothetical protein
MAVEQVKQEMKVIGAFDEQNIRGTRHLTSIASVEAMLRSDPSN